jgi:hypothetical protein
MYFDQVNIGRCVDEVVHPRSGQISAAKFIKAAAGSSLNRRMFTRFQKAKIFFPIPANHRQ